MTARHTRGTGLSGARWGDLAGVLRAMSFAASGVPTVVAEDVPSDWPWFAEFAGPAHASTWPLFRGLAGADLGPTSAPDWLGDAYQRLLEIKPSAGASGGRAHARRRSGSYYTPPAIASRLTAAAIGPILDAAEAAGPRAILALRICDPACGSGRFLVAAAELIARRLARVRAARPDPDDAAHSRARRDVVSQCLRGIDSDPLAAELCRFALARFSGLPRAALVEVVHVGDALLQRAAGPNDGLFDATVGNPPFLNQLQTATSRSATARDALSARYPGALRPYTDTSALFLLRALELVRPGGRIALIQPQSLLASRDAEPIRRRLTERCAVEGLWTAGPGIFAAQVHVCAPILRVGTPAGGPVRRWHGPEFTSLPDGAAADATPASWAPLIADTCGLPRFEVRPAGSIADLAAATADFRDQFYGLRGCIVEDADLTAVQRRRFPRIVTTGLVDAGACLWGARPCRLLGQSWIAPRADPAALERAGLGPWSRLRLVPKILLATQTRVLEAVVDSRGDLLPVTPLITITPRDPADLWRLAAALLAPPLTAWAFRHSAGTGLTAGAIKLSAKQVLTLPLPAPSADWARAAKLIRAIHDTPGLPTLASDPRLIEAGERMCRAYKLDAATSRALLNWWRERLSPRRGPARTSRRPL